MQYIYNLIAFSEKYIDAQEEYSKIDNILSKMSRQECRQYHEEHKDIFDKIKKERGLGEAEVIKIMRSNIEAGSFKLWRKRVSGRSSKHEKRAKLLSLEVE